MRYFVTETKECDCPTIYLCFESKEERERISLVTTIDMFVPSIALIIKD
jgi:hypothetical protein